MSERRLPARTKTVVRVTTTTERQTTRMHVEAFILHLYAHVTNGAAQSLLFVFGPISDPPRFELK